MEGIFGIGIPELLLVFVLALILLGPKDMVATARKMGVWVNRLIRSPLWREIINASQQIRDIPTQIVREAGLEESIKEIKDTTHQVRQELTETTTQVASDLKEVQGEALNETQAALGQAKDDFHAAAAPEPAPAADPSPTIDLAQHPLGPPPASEPFAPAPPAQQPQDSANFDI